MFGKFTFTDISLLVLSAHTASFASRPATNTGDAGDLQHRRHRRPATPIMDENNNTIVDCETSLKMKKPKFGWDNRSFMVFVDSCLIKKKGRKATSSFDKIGWENIQKRIKEKTGYSLEKKQLTNKWENMKKEWKLYDRLMRLETGLGGTRSLVDASPEWWEEKIKENKDYAKFRNTDLSIFDEKYAFLFRDSVAVGDQTMTPLQFKTIAIQTKKIWRAKEIVMKSI
ncbi:L10-interacting MYB domain-containing protein-like [Lactuca sativa]|uniref:L10-interacting MYB domain-containing protein-like n=1 Tax=Lactuca sativa TaxID=4236 RepID=UPI0022AF4E1C|nr:L10-interacting MYB domain-containing protein-like [Lactuca sativa]